MPLNKEVKTNQTKQLTQEYPSESGRNRVTEA